MNSKKEKENPDSNNVKNIIDEQLSSKEEQLKENKKDKNNNNNSKKHINKIGNNNIITKSTKKKEEDEIGLWKCWKEHPPTQIPGNSQISLMGWSIAALRTNFYIKELGLMLDAGLSSPNWVINHLLITHCHSDHCANLPFHLYSHKPQDKIKIYVPKGIELHIKEFIESAYLLSSHTFPEEENIKREELHLYNYYELHY